MTPSTHSLVEAGSATPSEYQGTISKDLSRLGQGLRVRAGWGSPGITTRGSTRAEDASLAGLFSGEMAQALGGSWFSCRKASKGPPYALYKSAVSWLRPGLLIWEGLGFCGC